MPCTYTSYCPQFDALIPSMTAREHLTLFARLKGVREKSVHSYVNDMIRALGLQSGIADEMVGSYSGGNKRKVCVGIALLGDPKVVLLDEPSAGMDPKARRFMWDLINNTVHNRSIILTTHSMEEAEMLCHRIGIMCAGELHALGSNTQLKSKYGKYYQLDMNVPTTHYQNQCKSWLQQLYPGTLVSEIRGDNMIMKIPKQLDNDLHTHISIGSIFRSIEQNKKIKHINQYSVTEVTLEQIFMYFARLQEHENMTEDARQHAYIAEQKRLQDELRDRRLRRLRKLQRIRRKRAETRARSYTNQYNAQFNNNAVQPINHEDIHTINQLCPDGNNNDRSDTQHSNEQSMEPAPYLAQAYQQQLNQPQTNNIDNNNTVIQIDPPPMWSTDSAPPLSRFMSERPVTAEDLDRGYNSGYEFATDNENDSDIDGSVIEPTADELHTLQRIEQDENERMNRSANNSMNNTYDHSQATKPTGIIGRTVRFFSGSHSRPVRHSNSINNRLSHSQSIDTINHTRSNTPLSNTPTGNRSSRIPLSNSTQNVATIQEQSIQPPPIPSRTPTSSSGEINYFAPSSQQQQPQNYSSHNKQPTHFTYTQQ